MTDQATFASRLLAWWDINGRHDLPWQHPRTPYRVWVSEIMLQQTQVSTVIPYFERFTARFPSLPDLAAAPLDDILGLWSGLGYYARARNLHKTAVLCVERHAGELPACPAVLATLPGIGESTANAIVSQAHDVPATVLDGNVRRVLARHGAVGGWTGKPDVAKKLWRMAESRLPDARGADYTQAIMDLGATLCRRTRPRCPECPVSQDCQALMADAVTQYPTPKPRPRVSEQDMFLLLMLRPDGSVLMERRPPTGIWGGLWCLPEANSLEQLAVANGLAPAELDSLPAIEHRLTHRLLKIQPLLWRSDPAARPVKCSETQRWVQGEEWPRLGLPRPVKSLLETCLTGEDR